MRVLAVIPARFASTRFPGKPLALLQGKPIIQWVWERVSEIVGSHDTVVATDDSRILSAVANFGGKAIMTSTEHRSGTDRCGEVLQKMENEGRHYDIVINIQGDEPFVQSDQITTLIHRFNDSQVEIATLRTPIRNSKELHSPNNVKVVSDTKGRALYFSRHALPYFRGKEPQEWSSYNTYYKHVGIYAFRSTILQQVVKLPFGSLEQCESLEQLRWLEQGYTIHLCDTNMENIGIDTPEDLLQAEQYLIDNPNISIKSITE